MLRRPKLRQHMHVPGYQRSARERRNVAPTCGHVIDRPAPLSIRVVHPDPLWSAPMKTKLSKILYDKGWTEMELSRRTGLAQSYINRVKNARETRAPRKLHFGP